MCIYLKNHAEVLIEITLNLHVNVERAGISPRMIMSKKSLSC